MKTRHTTYLTAALLAVAALWPQASGAEATMHGRISFDAGGTLVKGAEESDWTSAAVNTLILPNDTVWVDNGGTTELEFSGGSFLRMADGSKAEIVALPPNGVIRGWVGSFYVHRLSRSSGDFVFETPAASVQVEKDSMVRVDIVEDGITTVSTRWGRATVRTDAGGTVYAYEGRRVFVEAGLLPSEPTPFDRSNEDAFDRWNRERAEYLATGSTNTPVEIKSDTLGVTDLDRYGEWVYVDNRPCWRPTVVVDYTPYRYGYWNHVGSVGNVWVGRYPFSYVTTHYGYWDYTPSYGWVWSYGREWSPAWCATVRYGDYFVWAPVNRFHRPVYPHTSAYFSIGGVSFGYYGTSVVHVSNLYSGPRYVHYANYDPFRRYYGSSGVNINIWNINTGSRRPHVRVPYSNDSVFTVRDYTPRRSIRGASSLYTSSRSASERAQRLESAVGRGSFRRSARTGAEFTRTDATRIDRSNRSRTVRLSQSAPDYTRASRSNPVRARSTDPDIGSERTTLTRTRDRQDSTRGRGTIDDGNVRSRSTATRGRSTGDSVESSGRTRSRSATVDRDSGFDNDPLRTQTRTMRSGSRGDASDTATRRTTAPDTRATSRGDSGRTRSSASSTRTQVRTSAPRVNVAPDYATVRNSGVSSRSRSSSAGESTRDRGRTSTEATRSPRTDVPERATTSSRSSGSTRSRSYTAPSRTSTSRSSRSDSSPSASSRDSSRTTSVSPPSSSARSSRSYTTPSRSSNSSRSYTAPSRSSSSTRSFTAPNRGTESSRSRSYTAPSRSSNSSRSYTAPSRSSSSTRSFTAPSRGTESSRSRSYTAPSRSSNSSRSYTAPSRSSSSTRSFSRPSSSSGSRSMSRPSSSSSSRSVSRPSSSSSSRSFTSPSRGSSSRSGASSRSIGSRGGGRGR